MESGTTWGSWLAYGAIGFFLLLVFLLFVRTMMLFATLTFMPLARALRRLGRIGFRRER